MPKAKFKRKGAVVPLFDNPQAKRLRYCYANKIISILLFNIWHKDPPK